MASTPQGTPVEIVAFDFDGTCIDGNSPVILVRYLRHKKLLKKRALARILLWGIAYKLRLPQNESWVRGAVFSSFEGEDKAEVDAFLEKFYDERIERLFRPKIDEEIARHRAAGREVWAVTATFEPLIRQAATHHDYTSVFATRMATDEEGRYTCEVDGVPVEGEEKAVVINREANARFGEGNWRIVCAYGDHHSDEPMLSMAEHAYAVSPDRPLRRYAKARGWTILKW